MTKEEYLSDLKEINDIARAKRKEVHKEYALSNAKFKVGDIIESKSLGIILIEKIGFNFSEGWINDSWCYYSGVKLRKSDLTPYKSGEMEYITGNRNDIKRIEK